MKVIKLNRRYRLFKLGYTHAVMSDSKLNMWAEQHQLEKAAQATLGDQYTNWNSQTRHFDGPWATGYFKKNNRNDSTRYYIAVKREQDLSMIILRAQLS